MRKVKDLVVSPLALRPVEHRKSTTFENPAGGKLYNLVAEDERVDKELFERGGIKSDDACPTE
jgi:hypothetical protein